MEKRLTLVNEVSGQERAVNWSTIKTLLIKEAAKCEMYSSDIVIDINEIQSFLDDVDLETTPLMSCVWVLGFRAGGVDLIGRYGHVYELLPFEVDESGCHDGLFVRCYRRILAVVVRKGSDDCVTVRLEEMV